MTDLHKFDLKEFDRDLEIAPLEYEFGRAMYMWVNDLLFRYLYREAKWSSDLPLVFVFENDNCRGYVSFCQAIIDKTLDKFLYQDGSAAIEAELKEYSEKIDSIITNFHTSSPESLADTFEKYFDALEHMHLCAFTLRKVDKALIRRIQASFGEDASDILAHCNVTERLSFAAQEELALCELATKVGGDIESPLKALYDKFHYLTLGYFNEKPRDIDYYREKLRTIINEGAVDSKRKIEGEHIERLAERDSFLRKYESEAPLLRLVGESAWLKDYFKACANKAQDAAEKLWQEAEKISGHTIDSLKRLTWEDLFSLLRGGNVDWERVESYNKKSVLVVKTQSYNYHLIGEEAEIFEKKYLQLGTEKKNEFKGRIACKGTAKGVVKIVLSHDDFFKVEEGDIIVVQNTSPDFVSVLGKVSAIIAEEGGITAHVSVISREMKIPAIVGVSGITKHLQDGEEVLVDANTGIITKL
jgi:phosphohistidine swiveling domain-containing protein